MYNDILGDRIADDWEIVLVGEQTEKLYFEFKQPWLALPFDKPEKSTFLKKTFGVRGLPTVVRLDGSTGKPLAPGGSTPDVWSEDVLDAWGEMKQASSSRDLLLKWNATYTDSGNNDKVPSLEAKVEDAMFGFVDKLCPSWWPGAATTEEEEQSENPDSIVSFERVCRNAAVVWLCPLILSAIGTPFVTCASGGPIWAYVLAFCPAAWAAYNEIGVINQMSKFTYMRNVSGGWFQYSFNFHAKVKQRQFFTYGILPVKGPFGSMLILLVFSFLDWFDFMAKWFFVVSSHQCQALYDIDDMFSQSFKPVPVIGAFLAWFVDLVGVSGIAFIFFVVFIIGLQGLRGFRMLYNMSEKNNTYKRSIADLTKASGFASMRMVERLLSDAALQQELGLKERLDGECHKKDEWRDYEGLMAPRTECDEELKEMGSKVTKVLNTFFWNVVFIFGVRILGENMMIADLQSSYVGLMWRFLDAKGVAVATLSVVVSAMCSVYKLAMIIYMLSLDYDATKKMRYMSWCMFLVLLCLAVHIFGKIWAAYTCPYHLFSVFQMGCYQPV